MSANSGINKAACGCFIIPGDILEKLSKDKKIPEALRQAFANTLKFEQEWRKVRAAFGKLSLVAGRSLSMGAAPAGPPAILVNDCKQQITLPGTPVPNPGTSTDATAKRTFVETKAVADFYRSVFGRNSVDNAGKTLLSSIHYSVGYNNAFWNGNQMTYGDGDGNIFVDFTKSNDVICHELTHGVTQYTSGFAYSNEPGGLNESISDVFGTMFRQWRAGQDVTKADWLIGKEIMGPGAIARGYKCLRDMSNPAAKHCMAPQITKYSQYTTGMDPHYSSGVPNFAFYKAAVAVGGRSWEKVGKVWYHALTAYSASPNLKMAGFAARTRSSAQTLFPAEPAVFKAVDAAWKAVGL